jgi:hypothetical protein
MQAIARVNRVFRDKPAGLIVDYIGIAQNLISALSQYSRDDQKHAGIDGALAVPVRVPLPFLVAPIILATRGAQAQLQADLAFMRSVIRRPETLVLTKSSR